MKKLVSMKDLSITHYKAHDYHVMRIVFLPIAIRAIKLEFLKMAITRMYYFFFKISQKTIGNQELSDLHEFVVETKPTRYRRWALATCMKCGPTSGSCRF